MSNTVHKSIHKLISSLLGVDRQQIGPQTDLTADLGADSLEKIAVAIQLEEEFGVRVSDVDALKAGTVDDVAHLIDKVDEQVHA